MEEYHIPVMLQEVVDAFLPVKEDVIVDGTLGGGGHSEAILKNFSKSRIIGIDADKDALKFSLKRLAPYAGRARIIYGNFKDIRQILHKKGIKEVGGILLDLGVSSRQLENEKRGFSFLRNGKLDMRMDKAINRSAYDLVNSLSEFELREILKKYGEEKWASKIARNIVSKRSEKAIETTQELSQIVVDSIPAKYQSKKIHPATKTFLALRIAVNSELENLKTALREAMSVLKKGGRLCVISYHSLEDRIVKQFLLENEKGCICPPEIVKCVCGKNRLLKRVTKKPIRASKEEIEFNPRARSALLRIAEKV
ncbi:MAG: 16S rRNA (cytosine(1402)-N(4))-methyltransferase RsmH [Candidatus Schekmanbacteria bacterium]|nr:MAG: 16S rRNA (cytosine(1402)-N(4))-methyltransferase RsmH [Candidatus Schekmanbacteria bacterium]